MAVDRDHAGERQKDQGIEVLSEQAQIELHRGGKNQSRKKEIEDGAWGDPDPAQGLQNVKAILRERRQDADDHQTDRVGES